MNKGGGISVMNKGGGISVMNKGGGKLPGFMINLNYNYFYFPFLYKQNFSTFSKKFSFTIFRL